MMEWQVFFTLFTLHQCHQYPCDNLSKSGGLLVLSLSPLKACKNFVLQCVSMNVFSWPCLIWCGCALLVWFSAMLNKDGHVSCYRMAFLTMLMSSFPIFTDGGFQRQECWQNSENAVLIAERVQEKSQVKSVLFYLYAKNLKWKM